MLKIQLISADFTVLPLSTLSSCLFLPAYLSLSLFPACFSARICWPFGSPLLWPELCLAFQWQSSTKIFIISWTWWGPRERGAGSRRGVAWRTGDSRTNNNKEQRSARIAALISIKYTECIKTKMSSRTNFANAFFDKVLARTLTPFPHWPAGPPSCSCPVLYGSCHIGQLFALFQ